MAGKRRPVAASHGPASRKHNLSRNKSAFDNVFERGRMTRIPRRYLPSVWRRFVMERSACVDLLLWIA
jgi:hypothetical protein